MEQQLLFESNQKRGDRLAGSLSKRGRPRQGVVLSETDLTARIPAYSWPCLPGIAGRKVPLIREVQTRGHRQILIGSLGDPYGSDASCSLTKSVLETWSREWGKSIWLITRSSRVVRDLHRIRALSVRHRILVSVILRHLFTLT